MAKRVIFHLLLHFPETHSSQGLGQVAAQGIASDRMLESSTKIPRVPASGFIPRPASQRRPRLGAGSHQAPAVGVTGRGKAWLTSFSFLRFIYFYWKGSYTDRRDREEDLPSDDSLPKWPQRLELSQSETRSLFWVSHAGARSQGFAPSSTTFPGHRQGAERAVGDLGYEPASKWDPGACKVRTLVARLPQQDLKYFFFFKEGLNVCFKDKWFHTFCLEKL